jgi:hypothetical protein
VSREWSYSTERESVCVYRNVKRKKRGGGGFNDGWYLHSFVDGEKLKSQKGRRGNKSEVLWCLLLCCVFVIGFRIFRFQTLTIALSTLHFYAVLLK